jgi:MFS family permease
VSPASAVDSGYSWLRLAIALLLMGIGGGGMYVVGVVLPEVQAEFGSSRSGASMPYTLTMIGFGLGGILMGRLADRFGILVPVVIGACGLGAGFMLAGNATALWQFTLAQGLLIGLLGTSATFAPLMADTTMWFERRRGLAVAICASGNYIGGAIWPPVVRHFVETVGWRATYIGIGVFCVLSMVPLALMLRRRPPANSAGATAPAGRMAPVDVTRPLGMSPAALQQLLVVAGIACCVAMAMPQVHIVAYCTDLGYGATRGAQMLSVMLGFGVVSRLLFGMLCDRIGGLRTLLVSSALQTVALALFLPFDGMATLFVISALFGLFQGGIVPSYAIIVRELFSPREAGARVGTVIMATMLGMALGGWLSGAIFDITGSYDAAFINGIAWNLLNVGIVLFLLRRSGGYTLTADRRSASSAPASSSSSRSGAAAMTSHAASGRAGSASRT